MSQIFQIYKLLSLSSLVHHHHSHNFDLLPSNQTPDCHITRLPYIFCYIGKGVSCMFVFVFACRQTHSYVLNIIDLVSGVTFMLTRMHSCHLSIFFRIICTVVYLILIALLSFLARPLLEKRFLISEVIFSCLNKG